jgi:hypothetical protein
VEKNLFAEGFLRVADSILNLPGYLFGNAFALEVRIVRHLPRLFPDLALYFVNLACDFILNAWLPLADSCAEIRLQLRARTSESSSFRGAPMPVDVRDILRKHHTSRKEDWGMSRSGHFLRLISHCRSGTLIRHLTGVQAASLHGRLREEEDTARANSRRYSGQ